MISRVANPLEIKILKRFIKMANVFSFLKSGRALGQTKFLRFGGTLKLQFYHVHTVHSKEIFKYNDSSTRIIIKLNE